MSNKRLIIKLFEILKKKKLTISSVESFTGGLFASTITSVSGASNFFKGSLVSYSTQIKEEILKIDKKIIENYSVVSQEVADLMCLKGKELLKSDICISFTGNAGPSVCEGNKTVGLIYFSIFYNGKTYSFKKIYKYNRNKIRKVSVKTSIIELLKILENY